AAVAAAVVSTVAAATAATAAAVRAAAATAATPTAAAAVAAAATVVVPRRGFNAAGQGHHQNETVHLQDLLETEQKANPRGNERNETPGAVLEGTCCANRLSQRNLRRFTARHTEPALPEKSSCFLPTAIACVECRN